MALTFGNSHGALNGTTPVDVVAAPAASTQRVVRNVVFHNRDSAAVVITLRLDDGGTERVLDIQTVQAGETWIYGVTTVLADTDHKLEAVMSGAPAGTNPDFVAAWADKTA